MPDNPILIDKAQARRFLLSHFHLLPPRKLRGESGVLEYIRRVNCIQYDPINVVGQNSHLVLQSRVRGYRPAMLDALLYADRKLIDGFDKQMSIYPAEDWPQFGYYRERMAARYMESQHTAAAAKLVQHVRVEIKARGPLSSLDFEENTRMDWWLTDSVRAVRIALDMLLYGGETVVNHRVGTRRHFDLTQRVLPARLLNAPTPHASPDEYLEWHVYRRAGGVGLVGPNVTAAYGGMIGWQGGRIRAAIGRLAEKGRFVPVEIAELQKKRFHVRAEDVPALMAASKPSRSKPAAAFIAPLDNLMWDGDTVKRLFDFDYTWEVYKPAEKRKYGYYVLPVLYGDRFVARMDPAFDRVSKVFTIKNWWWENGTDRKDEAMLAAIGDCLNAFGGYLGSQRIELGPAIKGEPELARTLVSP